MLFVIFAHSELGFLALLLLCYLQQKLYSVSTIERTFLTLCQQVMRTVRSATSIPGSLSLSLLYRGKDERALDRIRSQVFYMGTRLARDPRNPCAFSARTVRAPKTQKETADSQCGFF